MSDPIFVDSHLHLFQSAEECLQLKQDYEIWEYGRAASDITYSQYNGTIDEAVEAMEAAGVAKAISLNLFMGQILRNAAIAEFPEKMSEAEREKAVKDIDARLVDELIAYNKWGCDVVKDHPQIVPFASMDVTVLPGEAGVAHLRDLVESHGAKGVKLHGAAQGFHMADPRLRPIYDVCRELGLPIIGHSGPDQAGRGFAEPRAFGEMMKAYPDLTVVLAHMGGGTWQQTEEIAAAHPNVYFDCCEIIEWTAGDKAPSDAELARLIQDVGPGRVMMGSDFPWYDLDRSIDRVMELPLLSKEEKTGIVGSNAVTILGL